MVSHIKSFCLVVVILFTACDRPKNILNNNISRPPVYYSETIVEKPRTEVDVSKKSELNPGFGYPTNNGFAGGIGSDFLPPIPPIPPVNPIPEPPPLITPPPPFLEPDVPLILAAFCGDGIIQIPEVCDDGNDINWDDCNVYCTIPWCGNGITDGDEECDDGNINNADGCNSCCHYERCGNFHLDPVNNFTVPPLMEQCDNGLYPKERGCSGCCLFELCGNEIVDPGEQCDLGEQNGTDGENCSSLCQFVNCPSGSFCEATDSKCP